MERLAAIFARSEAVWIRSDLSMPLRPPMTRSLSLSFPPPLTGEEVVQPMTIVWVSMSEVHLSYSDWGGRD